LFRVVAIEVNCRPTDVQIDAKNGNEHQSQRIYRTMKSILILLAIAITTVNSFTLPINRRYAFAATTRTRLYSDNSNENNSGSKTKFGEQATSVEERFLTDFRTADGELVDPYKLLNIKRSATKTEIKESYRRLSRKLHPDAQQSNILPGRW